MFSYLFFFKTNSIHLSLSFLMLLFLLPPGAVPLSLSPWFKAKLLSVGIMSLLLCILHSALNKALVMVNDYCILVSELAHPFPPSLSFFLFPFLLPPHSELPCSQPTYMNHSSISQKGTPSKTSWSSCIPLILLSGKVPITQP